MAKKAKETKIEEVKVEEKVEEQKPEKGKWYIVIPLSRHELRIKEVRSPNDVESYIRRNLIANYRVFQGKDKTRTFRSYLGRT